MIIEVAFGVCLGIVLAVLVLKFWRQLVTGSIAVLVVAVLGVVGLLIWLNLEKVAAVAGAVAMIAVVYGVPFWIYGWVSKRYPGFSLLLKGEPPWNGVARLPVRLLIMLTFAVAIGALGVGALLGGVALLDYTGGP